VDQQAGESFLGVYLCMCINKMYVEQKEELIHIHLTLQFDPHTQIHTLQTGRKEIWPSNQNKKNYIGKSKEI